MNGGIPLELQEDINALNTGKIDLAEFRQRQYIRRQKELVPEILKYRQHKEWEKFIDETLCCYEVMPIAFRFYDEVPDSMKYQFCTEAYTHHGDSIPAVRKAVRGALKYGKPELPAEIAGKKEITVYRAGEEPIEKTKYRISWTLDIKVARFFLSEYMGRHARFLYKGKIKPEKIIAYTNDRQEQEIMQYGNVYDIEEIEAVNAET